MLLFLEAIKPGEIILILAVVLLLFGGKKDAAGNKEGDDTKGQLK